MRIERECVRASLDTVAPTCSRSSPPSRNSSADLRRSTESDRVGVASSLESALTRPRKEASQHARRRLTTDLSHLSQPSRTCGRHHRRAEGIGGALVSTLPARRRVSSSSIQEEPPTRLVERLRDTGLEPPVFLPCNLTDSARSTPPSRGVVGRRFDRIDVLVNNAGNDTLHTIEEVTSESWGIGHHGSSSSSSSSLPPRLQYRSSGGPVGSVINMSSIAWVIPSTGLPVYVTAKAGVVGLTRTLAHELGRDNIPRQLRAPRSHNHRTAKETLAHRGVPRRSPCAPGYQATHPSRRGRPPGPVSCSRRQLRNHKPRAALSMIYPSGARHEAAASTG